MQRQEQMFSVIEQLQQSNLPQHIFCKEQGNTCTTFYYWLRRYRLQQERGGGFLSVNVSSAHEGFIEVRYPSGVILQLPSGISLSGIKQLISL